MICVQSDIVAQWSLDEIAVLEAANRALAKVGSGKRFDPFIFNAVAKAELQQLLHELKDAP